MPATIVVGGQFGSEGKGKVTTLIALREKSPWVVRCGGPNSGHTTSVDGEEVVLRQLPVAVGQEDAILCLSAGCVIDETVLLEELDRFRVDRERIFIDPRAVLLDASDRDQENVLSEAIGSTASGTGVALSRRMLRSSDVRLAHDSSALRSHATVRAVAPLLHDALATNQSVVVEGTQGFGLSLIHGVTYPYVTARDTTAAAFVSEVGLSPRDVDDIVLVLRTFPIRVGGPSGPLDKEISWDDIQSGSGSPLVEKEYTSVTGRLRRVAHFDVEQVRQAISYNRPTSLAVMGLDRLDYQDRGAESLAALSARTVDFLSMLRGEFGVPISWIGTGFGTMQAIQTKAEYIGEVANAR